MTRLLIRSGLLWLGTLLMLGVAHCQPLPVVTTSNGAPTSGCGANWLNIDITTGNLYDCLNSNWHFAAGGGVAGVSSVSGDAHFSIANPTSTPNITFVPQPNDYAFTDISGTINVSQLPAGGSVWLSGSGDPGLACTAPGNLYLDTSGVHDAWYCSATNVWRKFLTTTNSGVWSLTGLNGADPCGTVAANNDCLSFNSSDQLTIKDSTQTVRPVGSPASPTNSIQFNNAGAFGGSSGFLYANTALATPAGPAVVTHGTTGATTYGYRVSALNSVGYTLWSTETTIATGNATIDNTNWNEITPGALTGSVSFDVFRTTGGAAQGWIGNVAAGGTLQDKGLSAVFVSGGPIANTTQGELVTSNALVPGRVSLGNNITASSLRGVTAGGDYQGPNLFAPLEIQDHRTLTDDNSFAVGINANLVVNSTSNQASTILLNGNLDVPSGETHAVPTIEGMSLLVNQNGTGAVSQLDGATIQAYVGSSAVIDTMWGNQGTVFVDSTATISTRAAGVDVSYGSSGTATIAKISGIEISSYSGVGTDVHGLLIGDVNGGTNKYAIKTGAGKIQFGDLSASLPVQTNASKQLISQAIDLSGSQVTGTLATARLPTITSTQLATVNTRQVCDIPVGDTTGSALVNGQLGPQSRICYIPYAATIVEMDVNADNGTPNVIVGVNHAGSISNIVSSALATAASGGIACSKTTGVTGLNGVTTCSATLQNTSMAAGDYLELVSGTAGGTAKFFVVHVIYTIN